MGLEFVVFCREGRILLFEKGGSDSFARVEFTIPDSGAKLPLVFPIACRPRHRGPKRVSSAVKRTTRVDTANIQVPIVKGTFSPGTIVKEDPAILNGSETPDKLFR